MAANDTKRFSWFRCDHEFFNSTKTKALSNPSKSDGFDLAALNEYEKKQLIGLAAQGLYVKLLSEACTHEGVLMFDPDTPYDDEVLSQVLGVPESFFQDFKRKAMRLNLLKMGKEGEVILPELKKRMGSISGAGLRMRNYRLGDEENGCVRRNEEREVSQPISPETAESEKCRDTDKGEHPLVIARPPDRERPENFMPESDVMNGGRFPPTLDDVIREAASRGVPKSAAVEWYTTNQAQGWAFVGRDGKKHRISPTAWPGQVRKFYLANSDKYKSEEGGGDHAITRDELNAYAATVSPNLKFPLVTDDVDMLWGFLATKQFRHKGVVITKDNCGELLSYRIQDLMEEKGQAAVESSAPSESACFCDDTPPTPEVSERDYKRKMQAIRDLLAKDEEKLRMAQTSQDRYCAEQMVIKRHCDMLLANYNYGKRIVEYESRDGRKWPCGGAEKLDKKWKLQPYYTLYRGVWKRYDPQFGVSFDFGQECEQPEFS